MFSPWLGGGAVNVRLQIGDTDEDLRDTVAEGTLGEPNGMLHMIFAVFALTIWSELFQVSSNSVISLCGSTFM